MAMEERDELDGLDEFDDEEGTAGTAETAGTKKGVGGGSREVDFVDGVDGGAVLGAGTAGTKKGETRQDASSTLARYAELGLEVLIPTPDNSRTITKTDPKVLSLAASMRALGVLEPVLARPHPERPGYFDLRAGARRHCAAGLAGLKTLPCMVREMTDAEAFEVTMAENWQREDLTPMEESRGIAAMLAHGWTLEQVSAQCGKSVKWVARRAKLQELSGWWKDAAEYETAFSSWGASHLELIARFPEAVQDTLLSEFQRDFKHSTWSIEKMTPRDLQYRLAQSARAIAHAPWKLDDARLVSAAGACSTCTKRSDCQPALFEEEDWVEGQYGNKKPVAGARCLDAACFDGKVAAHVARTFGEKAAEVGVENVVKVGSYESASKEKGVVESWQVQKCKKGAPGAQVVIDVDTGQSYYGLAPQGGKRAGGGGGNGKGEKTLKMKRGQWCVLEVKRRLEAGAAVDDDMLLPLVAAWGVNGALLSELEKWKSVSKWRMHAGEVRAELQEQLGRTFQRRLAVDLKEWVYSPQLENAKWVAEMYGWDWDEIEAAAALAKPEPKAWVKEKKGTAGTAETAGTKKGKKAASTKGAKDGKSKVGKAEKPAKVGGDGVAAAPAKQPSELFFEAPGPSGTGELVGPLVEVGVCAGLTLRFQRGVEGDIGVGYVVELGKGRRDVDPRHNGATELMIETVPRAAYDAVRQVRGVLEGKRGKATKLRNELERWWGMYCAETLACVGCGCTERDACVDEVSGEACHWVDEERLLCSGCKKG